MMRHPFLGVSVETPLLQLCAATDESMGELAAPAHTLSRITPWLVMARARVE